MGVMKHRTKCISIGQSQVFSQNPNGVNFYAELIFPDTTATPASVINALSSQGYLTNAFGWFELFFRFPE